MSQSTREYLRATEEEEEEDKDDDAQNYPATVRIPPRVAVVSSPITIVAVRHCRKLLSDLVQAASLVRPKDDVQKCLELRSRLFVMRKVNDMISDDGLNTSEEKSR